MNAARRNRFEQILMAPCAPTICCRSSRRFPGVTLEEIAAAIAWTIRRSKREGAKLERQWRLRNEPAAPRDDAAEEECG